MKRLPWIDCNDEVREVDSYADAPQDEHAAEVTRLAILVFALRIALKSGAIGQFSD
ncbi:MAG: hypothetical protein ABIP46_03515 [Polaromonas sp.]